MRLIDADALGIGKCNPDIFENKGYAQGWNEAIKIIEEAPTVDAEPVRHGRWMGTVCTACGESTDFYYDCNYCPQCGAKMDLGDDEK